MLATYKEMVEERAQLHTESLAIAERSGENGDAMSEEDFDRVKEINAKVAELDNLIKIEDNKAAELATIARRNDQLQLPQGIDAPESSVTGVRERVLDDPTRGFATAGDFYSSAYKMFVDHVPDSRLVIGAATGMSQGSGSEGGILVPPSFSQIIWDGMNVGAENLLGMTDQYDVEGDSLTMPANAETSRATGSRYGGVRAYWIAEAAQMTGSTPKLRDLKLEPKEMTVLVYVTDKLLRNSSAIGKYVTQAATDELRFMTGDAIINGDGAGKPLGLLAAASTVEITAEAGQVAMTIVAENVIKMWARMHARARQKAVWFINQACEPQLMTMAVAVGTGGQLIYMPAGGISGSAYGSLFGKPVVPIEYCQALGTAGDIILTDLSAYATGLKKQGVRSDVSIHLKFDYNETAFRFLFEVDGQPWLASALTPFKGSDTLGTAITVATRS